MRAAAEAEAAAAAEAAEARGAERAAEEFEKLMNVASSGQRPQRLTKALQWAAAKNLVDSEVVWRTLMVELKTQLDKDEQRALGVMVAGADFAAYSAKLVDADATRCRSKDQWGAINNDLVAVLTALFEVSNDSTPPHGQSIIRELKKDDQHMDLLAMAMSRLSAFTVYEALRKHYEPADDGHVHRLLMEIRGGGSGCTARREWRSTGGHADELFSAFYTDLLNKRRLVLSITTESDEFEAPVSVPDREIHQRMKDSLLALTRDSSLSLEDRLAHLGERLTMARRKTDGREGQDERLLSMNGLIEEIRIVEFEARRDNAEVAGGAIVEANMLLRKTTAPASRAARPPRLGIGSAGNARLPAAPPTQSQLTTGDWTPKPKHADFVCDNCGKKGHIRPDCAKAHGGVAPPPVAVPPRSGRGAAGRQGTAQVPESTGSWRRGAARGGEASGRNRSRGSNAAGGGAGGGSGGEPASKPPSRGQAKPTDRCNHCGQLGHWARDCPNKGAVVSSNSVSFVAYSTEVQVQDTATVGGELTEMAVEGTVVELQTASACSEGDTKLGRVEPWQNPIADEGLILDQPLSVCPIGLSESVNDASTQPISGISDMVDDYLASQRIHLELACRLAMSSAAAHPWMVSETSVSATPLLLFPAAVDVERAVALRCTIYTSVIGLLKPKLRVRCDDVFSGEGRSARILIDLDRPENGQRRLIQLFSSLTELHGGELPGHGARGRIALMLQTAHMGVVKHRHFNAKCAFGLRFYPPWVYSCADAQQPVPLIVTGTSGSVSLPLGPWGMGRFPPHLDHSRPDGVAPEYIVTGTIFCDSIRRGMHLFTPPALSWVASMAAIGGIDGSFPGCASWMSAEAQGETAAQPADVQIDAQAADAQAADAQLQADDAQLQADDAQLQAEWDAEWADAQLQLQAADAQIDAQLQADAQVVDAQVVETDAQVVETNAQAVDAQVVETDALAIAAAPLELAFSVSDGTIEHIMQRFDVAVSEARSVLHEPMALCMCQLYGETVMVSHVLGLYDNHASIALQQHFASTRFCEAVALLQGWDPMWQNAGTALLGDREAQWVEEILWYEGYLDECEFAETQRELAEWASMPLSDLDQTRDLFHVWRLLDDWETDGWESSTVWVELQLGNEQPYFSLELASALGVDEACVEQPALELSRDTAEMDVESDGDLIGGASVDIGSLEQVHSEHVIDCAATVIINVGSGGAGAQSHSLARSNSNSRPAATPQVHSLPDPVQSRPVRRNGQQSQPQSHSLQGMMASTLDSVNADRRRHRAEMRRVDAQLRIVQRSVDEMQLQLLRMSTELGSLRRQQQQLQATSTPGARSRNGGDSGAHGSRGSGNGGGNTRSVNGVNGRRERGRSAQGSVTMVSSMVSVADSVQETPLAAVRVPSVEEDAATLSALQGAPVALVRDMLAEAAAVEGPSPFPRAPGITEPVVLQTTIPDAITPSDGPGETTVRAFATQVDSGDCFVGVHVEYLDSMQAAFDGKIATFAVDTACAAHLTSNAAAAFGPGWTEVDTPMLVRGVDSGSEAQITRVGPLVIYTLTNSSKQMAVQCARFYYSPSFRDGVNILSAHELAKDGFGTSIVPKPRNATVMPASYMYSVDFGDEHSCRVPLFVHPRSTATQQGGVYLMTASFGASSATIRLGAEPSVSDCFATAPLAEQYRAVQYRLGGIPAAEMANVLSKTVGHGLNPNKAIKFCEPRPLEWQETNQNKTRDVGVSSGRVNRTVYKEGEEIHIDTLQFKGRSDGGYTHAMIATFPIGGRIKGMFMQRQDAAAWRVCIVELYAFVRSRPDLYGEGTRLRYVWCDRDPGFVASLTQSLRESHGLRLECSVGKNQHCIAETSNKKVRRKTNSILRIGRLPASKWPRACSQAILILNLLPNSANPGGLSADAFDGLQPDISSLRIVGAPCTLQIPVDKQSKAAGAVTAVSGTFMGNSSMTPGGVYVQKDGGAVHPMRLPVSRNVFVDERMHWLRIDGQGGDFSATRRPISVLTEALDDEENPVLPAVAAFLDPRAGGGSSAVAQVPDVPDSPGGAPSTPSDEAGLMSPGDAQGLTPQSLGSPLGTPNVGEQLGLPRNLQRVPGFSPTAGPRRSTRAGLGDTAWQQQTATRALGAGGADRAYQGVQPGTADVAKQFRSADRAAAQLGGNTHEGLALPETPDSDDERPIRDFTPLGPGSPVQDGGVANLADEMARVSIDEGETGAAGAAGGEPEAKAADVLSLTIRRADIGGDLSRHDILVLSGCVDCMALTLRDITTEHALGVPGLQDKAIAAQFSAVLMRCEYDHTKLIGWKHFPSGPEWADRAQAAFRVEWEKLCSLNTYIPILTSRLPAGMRPLSQLPLGENKIGSDGEFRKTKVRIVVNGSRQQRFVDFTDTSSPTISFDTMRTVLAIGVIYGMEIDAGDITNAYVNAFLDRKIALQQCIGIRFTDPMLAGERISLIGLNAHYGTKQAGRCWFLLFRGKMLFLRFEQSRRDACLFWAWVEGVLIILALWVDDVIVICPERRLVKALKEALEKPQDGGRFPALSFGTWDSPIQEFVGIGCSYNRLQRTLEFKHPFYLANIFTMYEFLGSLRGATCPTPTDAELNAPADDVDRQLIQSYSAVLGKLMYSMVSVLLGTSHAVGFCARSMAKPDLIAAKHLRKLCRFYKSHIETPLLFAARDRPDQVILYTLSDASFAPVEEARCVHVNGIVSFITYCCIRCKSTKAGYTAKTTLEAEFLAASEATTFSVGDRLILSEMGFPHVAVPLFIDNNSTLINVSGTKFGLRRTRHIAANYFNTLDYVESGMIDPRRVDTGDNIADIGTKHLTPVTYVRFFEHVQGTGDMSIGSKIVGVMAAQYEQDKVSLAPLVQLSTVKPTEPSRGSGDCPDSTGR